jgi:curved DNA-binding protein CbpA
LKNLFDTQKPTRYKIDMDIQNALKLLDLEPGATLEEARAAFKEKAKQFHPDKLMAASNNVDDGERMKDINVAYHTLKAVLRPGTSKKGTRLLPEKFSPACRRLVDRVRKWMADRRGPTRPAPAARTGTAPPRSRFKPSLPPKQGPEAFEEVLRQSMRRRLAREKRYTAYARYLELEKKMKQARQQRPGDAWDVDRVERVSRIKPVD